MRGESKGDSVARHRRGDRDRGCGAVKGVCAAEPGVGAPWAWRGGGVATAGTEPWSAADMCWRGAANGTTKGECVAERAGAGAGAGAARTTEDRASVEGVEAEELGGDGDAAPGDLEGAFWRQRWHRT
jgi:hypothetical protein